MRAVPCRRRLLSFLKQVPSTSRLRRCCLISSKISGWIFSFSSLGKKESRHLLNSIKDHPPSSETVSQDVSVRCLKRTSVTDKPRSESSLPQKKKTQLFLLTKNGSQDTFVVDISLLERQCMTQASYLFLYYFTHSKNNTCYNASLRFFHNK